MSISLIEPWGRAWSRMRQMLFQPFDLGKWMVLGFSAWLAGLLDGGGGGGNGGGGGGDGLDDLDDIRYGMERAYDYLLDHPVIIALIVICIVCVVMVLVLLNWISSRAKFIFLDNVVHDRAHIVEPWQRFRRLGNSLFLFRLVVGLVTLPIVLGMVASGLWLILAAFGVWSGPGFLFLWIALWTLLLLLLIVGGCYLGFFMNAFVVPIMYRFNIGILAAWQYFLVLFSSHPGWYLLCGLFVLGLFILAGACIVAAGILTCCIGFILVILPYIGTVALLPLHVVYRLFTLEFLAQFHSDLVLTREPAQ